MNPSCGKTIVNHKNDKSKENVIIGDGSDKFLHRTYVLFKNKTHSLRNRYGLDIQIWKVVPNLLKVLKLPAYRRLRMENRILNARGRRMSYSFAPNYNGVTFS